jgi:hypothetical protein
MPLYGEKRHRTSYFQPFECSLKIKSAKLLRLRFERTNCGITRGCATIVGDQRINRSFQRREVGLDGEKNIFRPTKFNNLSTDLNASDCGHA